MNEQLEDQPEAASRTAAPSAAAETTTAEKPARRTRQASPARHSASAARTRAALAEEVSETFFERNRVLIVAVALILMIGGAGYYLKPTGKAPVQKAPERMVFIQPLPPPPPPPKLPPPPKEKKVVEPEAAPVDSKPKDVQKPKEAPVKQALGTGLKGPGPGMAGLGGTGEGGGLSELKGGGGGTAWGFFAGQLQTTVKEALRADNRTKSSNIDINVRIWPDSAGRVTRATLDSSTGDKKLDEAIEKVLTGLQLQSPPPAGVHPPIRMHLKARRP